MVGWVPTPLATFPYCNYILITFYQRVFTEALAYDR